MKPKTAPAKTRKPAKVAAKKPKGIRLGQPPIHINTCAEDARLLCKVAEMTVRDVPKRRGRPVKDTSVGNVLKAMTGLISSREATPFLGLPPQTVSGYLVSVRADLAAIYAYFGAACADIEAKAEKSTHIGDEELVRYGEMQTARRRCSLMDVRLAMLSNMEVKRLEEETPSDPA